MPAIFICMSSLLRISPKFGIQFRKVFTIMVVWTIVGLVIALYDHFVLTSSVTKETSPAYNFTINVLTSMGAGFTAGSIFGTIMVFFVHERFRDKPYWVTILTVAILFMMIYSGIVLFIGVFILPAINPALSEEATREAYMRDFFIDTTHIKNAIIWGVVTIFTQFTLQINDKFGQGVLWKILNGKYQKPHQENRIFMFADLTSSTTIAEKLGNEKYHRLLRDFYADITNAIIYNKGEIYQYVGDEIIISWKLEKDAAANRSLKCYFDMQNTIRGLKEKYQSRYGLLPEFKAGIHYGPVMVGEIGIIKRDITYSGDVLNTTSRIQNMCNQYKVSILCSDDLLELLRVSAPYQKVPLGDIELKGKGRKVALSTIIY